MPQKNRKSGSPSVGHNPKVGHGAFNTLRQIVRPTYDHLNACNSLANILTLHCTVNLGDTNVT